MPINGILVNTLKKAKSLSGSERIPVYTTTKSKPSNFTTVDDILAKAPAQPTGGVTSINTQTGDLELATVNGASLLQNIDIPAGASLTYANVFFVDPVNGNNATGEVNRFDKPYLTYASASTAALALAPTQTAPALVVLRKGTYVENMLLKPYVYVKCDKGVVFTINGFYDDVNTVYSKVYGEACFYVNAQPLTQLWGSDIYFEFDECIQEATIFRGVMNCNANGYVQKTLVVCNRLESNCKNGFLITVRNGADAVIHVKQWIKGPGKLVNALYLTNVVKIFCPKLINDNRSSPVAVTSKTCINAQSLYSTGVLEIYGDLYNTSNNFTYSPGSGAQQACLYSLQCAVGSLIRVFGNIYAGETFGIYTVYSGGTDNVSYDIKGNISSKSIPVCFLGTTNKLKIEGEITKLLNDAIAAPCIYAINSCEVYAKNTHLKNYNTVNSNIVALDAATAKGYFYNCTAYTLGTGDVFLKDASTGVLGCVNTKGNVAIGATGATAAFSPQGYTQVTGAIVPNF
jgi:hypothetical protein